MGADQIIRIKIIGSVQLLQHVFRRNSHQHLHAAGHCLRHCKLSRSKVHAAVADYGTPSLKERLRGGSERLTVVVTCTMGANVRSVDD